MMELGTKSKCHPAIAEIRRAIQNRLPKTEVRDSPATLIFIYFVRHTRWLKIDLDTSHKAYAIIWVVGIVVEVVAIE